MSGFKDFVRTVHWIVQLKMFQGVEVLKCHSLHDKLAKKLSEFAWRHFSTSGSHIALRH